MRGDKGSQMIPAAPDSDDTRVQSPYRQWRRGEGAAINEPTDLKRRLSAIAFADVASFSWLMGLNEAETLRRWKAVRAEIMEPFVKE
jgi:class 3 adenylate cyclase